MRKDEGAPDAVEDLELQLEAGVTAHPVIGQSEPFDVDLDSIRCVQNLHVRRNLSGGLHCLLDLSHGEAIEASHL